MYSARNAGFTSLTDSAKIFPRTVQEDNPSCEASQDGLSSCTVLGNIFAESVRDVKPAFLAEYMSDYFAPSSHLPINRHVVALALDHTSVEISKIQEGNIAIFPS